MGTYIVNVEHGLVGIISDHRLIEPRLNRLNTSSRDSHYRRFYSTTHTPVSLLCYKEMADKQQNTTNMCEEKNI